MKDRFLLWADKVLVGDDCWDWTGGLDRDGYGQFWDGRTVHAYRYGYEVFKGAIPSGMQLDHLCRNKKCVRPDHLEPVTVGENKRRWAASITHCSWGHEYNKANTYVRANGSRKCRECARLRGGK